ncbi:MAG: hypothetical protein HRO68_09795 [Nitrosopumilus sp.]|nr:hypothetical protein [Nitrosopumilus sp.]
MFLAFLTYTRGSYSKSFRETFFKLTTAGQLEKFLVSVQLSYDDILSPQHVTRPFTFEQLSTEAFLEYFDKESMSNILREVELLILRTSDIRNNLQGKFLLGVMLYKDLQITKIFDSEQAHADFSLQFIAHLRKNSSLSPRFWIELHNEKFPKSLIELEEPKGETIQEPKGETIQEPKGETIQEPKGETIQEPEPIILSTDLSEYLFGDEIQVTAEVQDLDSGPITITFKAPNGNIIGIHQVDIPADGLAL